MPKERIVGFDLKTRLGLALSVLILAMGASQVEAGTRSPDVLDSSGSVIAVDGSDTSCLATLIKVDQENNMVSAYPKMVDKDPSSNEGPGLPLIFGALDNSLIRESIEGILAEADEVIKVKDHTSFEPAFQGDECVVVFPTEK